MEAGVSHGICARHRAEVIEEARREIGQYADNPPSDDLDRPANVTPFFSPGKREDQWLFSAIVLMAALGLGLVVGNGVAVWRLCGGW